MPKSNSTHFMSSASMLQTNRPTIQPIPSQNSLPSSVLSSNASNEWLLCLKSTHSTPPHNHPQPHTTSTTLPTSTIPSTSTVPSTLTNTYHAKPHILPSWVTVSKLSCSVGGSCLLLLLVRCTAANDYTQNYNGYTDVVHCTQKYRKVN